MQTATRYAQAYRTASVDTASPAKIVLMLFDGAIGFLQRALNGFDEEELGRRNEIITENLLKAQRIIHELRRSLDLDGGGDLAATLHQLYDYLDELILQANFKKDRPPILLSVELLGELRAGWDGMMREQSSLAAA